MTKDNPENMKELYDKEFDEFMDNVKNNGYLFGPIHKNYPGRTPKGSHPEYIKKITSEVSDQFILDSYMPVRDPNTGDIVSIKSLWDGESFTYEDSPSFFDKVARVFETRSINEVLGRNGGIK